MSRPDQKARENQSLEIPLVGIGLSHALSPTVHNFMAKSMGMSWKMIGYESHSIDDCTKLLRSSKAGGGVVTMPWKNEILKHLDHLDPVANELKACNVTFWDEEGKLWGSNTDWVGIEGAIRGVVKSGLEGKGKGKVEGKVAVVVGAGGASRAALYALICRFGVREVYILNRDEQEAKDLIRDCSKMGGSTPASIKHITSMDEVQQLPTSSYVISSVPDFEPTTQSEKEVKAMLASILSRPEKGMLLDMCYHPRWTRHMKLGREHGWTTASGIDVIGYQAEALWRFWVSDERLQKLDREEMWRTLYQAAESSQLINP